MYILIRLQLPHCLNTSSRPGIGRLLLIPVVEICFIGETDINEQLIITETSTKGSDVGTCFLEVC